MYSGAAPKAEIQLDQATSDEKNNFNTDGVMAGAQLIHSANEESGWRHATYLLSCSVILTAILVFRSLRIHSVGHSFKLKALEVAD